MNLADAIAMYAARFHAAIGPQHHVGSALGAWVLLSLVGDDAGGTSRQRLNELFGIDATEAWALAAGLLAHSHPSARFAIGAWADPTAAVAKWLARLPGQVERGRVPSQREADRWIERASQGLIKRFPGSVSQRNTFLLLASMVALSVRWREPFRIVPTTELGEHHWSRGVRTLLSDESAEARIVRTDVGLVAVHSAFSDDGSIRVDSVIASRDIPAVDVIRVAHRIATGHNAAIDVSLFDLPLDSHSLWTITRTDPNPGRSATGAVPRADPRMVGHD